MFVAEVNNLYAQLPVEISTNRRISLYRVLCFNKPNFVAKLSKYTKKNAQKLIFLRLFWKW